MTIPRLDREPPITERAFASLLAWARKVAAQGNANADTNDAQDATLATQAANATALAARVTSLEAERASLAPVFFAYLVTNAGMTLGAWSKLICDTEDIDTANAHSTSTGVYTIPRAGYWEFTAGMSVDANAGANLTGSFWGLFKNGGSNPFVRGPVSIASSMNNSLEIVATIGPLQCAVSDQFDARAYINGTGVSSLVFTGNASIRASFFAGKFLRPL